MHLPEGAKQLRIPTHTDPDSDPYRSPIPVHVEHLEVGRSGAGEPAVAPFFPAEVPREEERVGVSV